MKFKKPILFEVSQDDILVCDNLLCDFKIPNPTKDIHTETKQYINTSCPKCGDNLLTEEDYKRAKSFVKLIDFGNKWLWWLAIFNRRKKITNHRVGTHKYITIEDVTDQNNNQES